MPANTLPVQGTFAEKQFARTSPEEAFLESPSFRFNQQQNIRQQREANQRQDVFNQIARQQSNQDQARLGLQGQQFQFDTQQAVSNLLQELLGQQLALAQTQQAGIRGLSDLGLRLADTRFNVERQSLLDALRLNDINTQAAPARAARLIGRV